MSAHRVGLLAIAILATCFVGAPNAVAQAPTPSFGKANKDQIHAYIMLIRLRWDLYGQWKDTGKWPDDPAANKALSEHGRYWQEQLRQGRAILAGGMNGEYWDNAAMIIFEAPSQKEAEAIVAADPAVKAYVFQAQVRPFDVQFITNKFDSKPEKEAAPAK
jgi:uncharacterized protein YciI